MVYIGTYYNTPGLSIIWKDRVFYCKFDCSVLFLNGRNVVSLRTTVDECNFCWFAIFSNFEIFCFYEHLAEKGY